MSFTPNKLLNQRYRLNKILGRGGFGSTYLAEDTGRFHELCALKEIIPDRTSPEILAKSRQLFQREAATLYKLQHPQIPQFRATFEEEGSWFLVQDYIEGKTLRESLRSRLAEGALFSEAEVLRLLKQILPVLDYLHGEGIIHRDISPENIIVRENDGLPVLIDFGVVKELVTQIQSPHRPEGATVVGKIGYSPNEQFQRGEAYPSSDLYSLAATMVVLMTGREPRDLFDQENLAWNWQQWIQISEPLGGILKRMLSQRPGDRYPSAQAVLQALQGGFVPTQPSPAELSQMATVAVGGTHPTTSPRTNVGTQVPSVPQAQKGRFDPLLFLGMTLLISFVAGWGSWSLVTWWIDSRSPQVEEETSFPTPSSPISPSPTPTPTPSPTPTPTPTPEPPSISERNIDLVVGKTFTERSALEKKEDRIRYTFSAEEGQTLEAIARSGGVWMTILDSQGQNLSPETTNVQSWEGTFPTTANYAIELSAIPNVPQENYRYRLTLLLNNPDRPEPSPTPTPEPSPTPTPKPSPTPKPTPTPKPSPSPQTEQPRYDVEPVEVSPNIEGSKTQLFGTTSPDRIKRYLVFVEKGQTLSAEMQSGRATMNIYYPNGKLMEEAEKVVLWQIEAPRSGDYKIDIIAAESTDFALDVRVKAAGQ